MRRDNGMKREPEALTTNTRWRDEDNRRLPSRLHPSLLAAVRRRLQNVYARILRCQSLGNCNAEVCRSIVGRGDVDVAQGFPDTEPATLV